MLASGFVPEAMLFFTGHQLNFGTLIPFELDGSANFPSILLSTYPHKNHYLSYRDLMEDHGFPKVMVYNI